MQGEITAIASGVAPGDLVVVDGADKLREGAKVELITRDAQAAPPPAPRSAGRAAIGRRASGRGAAGSDGQRRQGAAADRGRSHARRAP